MIDKSIIQTTTSWPFVEARKLIKERKKIFEKKGKITLQTGYGPSGLPHIGTFGEVARTTMIVNALNYLTDLPKEIEDAVKDILEHMASTLESGDRIEITMDHTAMDVVTASGTQPMVRWVFDIGGTINALAE